MLSFSSFKRNIKILFVFFFFCSLRSYNDITCYHFIYLFLGRYFLCDRSTNNYFLHFFCFIIKMSLEYPYKAEIGIKFKGYQIIFGCNFSPYFLELKKQIHQHMKLRSMIFSLRYHTKNEKSKGKLIDLLGDSAIQRRNH